MSKLTGKVAVVTGASKGIGAAIARSLAAEGASVVVNYASSKAGADAVVAAISAAGGKAVAVHGDVSKAAEAQGIIDAAIKSYGRLDILVNNSGSTSSRRVLPEPREIEWKSQEVRSVAGSALRLPC
jgi:3-oxoacyl-[acyl-carrier protein] reductase